jgi:nucleoside-diphosphate-sugar epimerase
VKGVDSFTPFLLFFSKYKVKDMNKGKTYGVIGCGWLGLPIAEKWTNEQKKVHGTTTTEGKIELLKSKRIIPHILKDNIEEEKKEWMKEIDILLLCIPPSNLKEKYADFLVDIVKHLKPSAKTVMISSTSVYGNKNQIAIEEDTLDGTGRNTPFIIAAEKKLSAYAKESITTIRMSGLLGKDRNPAKYMQGRSISGGNEPVNLIHLQDCIGVIEHIINNNIWGETINASAPKHPTKKDFYVYSAEQLNIEPPTFNEIKQDSKIVSSDKLVNQYGYQFIYADPYTFPENKIGD